MNRIILFLLIVQIATASSQMNNSDTNVLFLSVISRLDINTTNQVEIDAFLQNNSIIVIGHDTSFSEKLVVEAAKTQNKWIGNVKEIKDSEFDNVDDYKLIILVGGPSQNNITKYAKDKFNESYEFEGGIIVETGSWNNAVLVSISDKQGYETILKRENVGYSPLSGIIPKEYIPVAATGISLVLLAFINIFRTVFEFKALNIGRKGKKVGEGSILVAGINISEFFAIVGASFILGASISWQYVGPTTEFFKWLLINSIICLAGAILHEVTHKIFAIIFKIKIEYKFWPAGSLITLISSYLGNAFSVQGFVLEEIDPKTKKWKVGLMKLAAPVVSTIVMVVFAVLYFFTQIPIFRIIYSTSALWAMAEMLPFNGLDGKDIKDWNLFIWLFAFLAIGAAYGIITFLL